MALLDTENQLPVLWCTPIMDGYKMEARATKYDGNPTVSLTREGPQSGRFGQRMTPDQAEDLGVKLIKAAQSSRILSGTAVA